MGWLPKKEPKSVKYNSQAFTQWASHRVALHGFSRDTVHGWLSLLNQAALLGSASNF